LRMPSKPRLHASCETSCINTGIPACAVTCAIPAPIWPAPITPTVCTSISILLSSNVRNVMLERTQQGGDVGLLTQLAAKDRVVALDAAALLLVLGHREQALEILEQRLRLELVLDRDSVVVDRDEQSNMIDHPVHDGEIAA